MKPTSVCRRLGLAVLLSAVLAACTPRPGPGPTPLLLGPQFTLGEVTPPVRLRLTGAADFETAVVGRELPAGSQVETGPGGQARIDLTNAAHLRLADNTIFTLPALQAAPGRTYVRLEAGKLWASLTGGTLDVESPGGLASLTGSFATFEYLAGNPATPTDDIFIVSCLTGACFFQHGALTEQLGDLDQVTVTGGAQLARLALDPSALADFRAQNPLVALIEPTITPTAEATPVLEPTAVAAATLPPPASATLLPTAVPPSATALVAATAVPEGLLGRHTVRSGETIYCIGRAYAVLPDAIAQANTLAPPYAIFANDVLEIPSAPWVNLPAGPVCAAQFPSPYLAPLGPTATPNSGPAPSATPAAAASAAPQPTAQVGDGVWQPPFNLSQSGAAMLPALAVEASGRQYALWWDRFDGMRASVFQPGVGWSPAAAAPSLVGATPQAPATAPIAPNDLRLLADGSGGLHAFWLDTENDLRYAQNLSGAWSASRVLIIAPLRWQVAVDTGGRLHLAAIQTQPTGAEPAGVYYRQSSTRGSQWTAPRVLATSPYYRTLADADAHLDLAVTAAGELFITWDDPQLFYSFYARSPNAGVDFEPAATLAASGPGPDSLPRHARMVPLGAATAGSPGGLLRLWQTTASCALYQEVRGPGASDGWSAPVRALEKLPGCLVDSRTFPLPGGGAFLLAGLQSGRANQAFALWDGQRWSEPLVPRISFVNRATNRPAALGCLTAGLSGEHVVALGCDARGDIWGTASQLRLSDLLPALSTAWSPPGQISNANTEAGLPSVTRDAAGRLHTLWTEVSTLGAGEPELVYARQTEDGWTTPNRILNPSDAGPANTPLLAAGSGDRLYAVWSGGLAGQVHLSRAFTRDAADSAGWLAPQLLPAPRAVGGWPAITIDAGGRLRVIFTIPFNEDRGLYLTESTDEGLTWSPPQLVFNAAEAGWSVLQDTQLVVDAAGGMHVLLARGALPPAVDPLGVYYLRSTDDGRTWTGPLAVSQPNQEAGYPRLIATRPGELHRLWIEDSGGAWLVFHQWSVDDGRTWTAATLVPGLRNMSRNLGLATDGSGALYLVGVEATAQQSAALFYLRWDGRTWVERETVPLGFGVDAASGATAVLLPTGYLGVLYRVTTSAQLGADIHLVGYTQRPIAAVVIAPLPTLTPAPVDSPTPTSAPTLTPTPPPTLDLRSPVTPAAANGGLWRIIAILVVMVVVALIAVNRLLRRR